MGKNDTLTKNERDILVLIANAYLADEKHSQDEKKEVFCTESDMLLHHTQNGYSGFNWIKWYKQGGAHQFFSSYPEWLHEMTSELNVIKNSEMYMGKEYDRFFY